MMAFEEYTRSGRGGVNLPLASLSKRGTLRLNATTCKIHGAKKGQQVSFAYDTESRVLQVTFESKRGPRTHTLNQGTERSDALQCGCAGMLRHFNLVGPMPRLSVSSEVKGVLLISLPKTAYQPKDSVKPTEQRVVSKKVTKVLQREPKNDKDLLETAAVSALTDYSSLTVEEMLKVLPNHGYTIGKGNKLETGCMLDDKILKNKKLFKVVIVKGKNEYMLLDEGEEGG